MWLRRLAVVAAVAAVVSPAIRDRDSFPLSTYPVYASVRPRTATLDTAFGVDGDGRERRLSMAVIAATDDPLIAASRVSDAVRSGTSGVLCRLIASRAPDGLIEIVVVGETHDVVDSARGDDSLVSRTVHARCRVGP
jgi:hypothetical protein